MLSAFDPPQTSLESPAHGVAHPEVGAPPLSIEFPQKHWLPNSMPAYRYPPAWHAAWHFSTVFPATLYDVLRVRALVESE